VEAGDPKTIIKVGDHISTGADSEAIIQFGDMTTLQVKPGSEVIVKTPPGQETKFGLVMGHMRANTKKMFTNGHMEVEMGQAVAGIKGTTFVCEETKSTSTLKVIEGTVSYTSKKNPKTVMVGTGEMATAGPTGMQEKRTFDVEAEKRLWKPLATKPETTGTASQDTNTSWGKKACSCMPLLTGIISLIATAIGGKIM
jgi:ferric-dicitrate binding protein FerR (iron transport regulator)